MPEACWSHHNGMTTSELYENYFPGAENSWKFIKYARLDLLVQTICLTLWSKTLRQRGRCKKRTAAAVVHMKLANNRFGNQLEDRAVS